FKPALLARMNVVPYYSLPPAYLTGIVDITLGRLAQRLHATNRIALEFGSEVSDAIAARCPEVDGDARNIHYILGKGLTPALADVVLAAMAQGQNLSALRVGMGEEGAWKIEPEYDEESVAESGDGMAEQEATS